MNKQVLLGLIACGLLGSGMPSGVGAKKCSGCCSPASGAASTEALTNAEARDLLFMREEEKLARDVYNAMHELYSQRVFSNIPRAEQRHMEAILGLLNAYGLDDPAKEDAGQFSNEELQKLHDTLVAQGAKSKQDAFLVGALIEEVDIEDIVEAMERTDKADILAVYSNLLSGSERHLNAFVRNYEAISGKTYTAQKISQEKVDAILGR